MRDNTEFWCCDEMLFEMKWEDLTIKEIIQSTGWKFCPHCGEKLSILA